MAPSRTIGAVRPVVRRPATKVVVFQCPQGRVALRRLPFRLRPRSRAMLVLAPVSSTKTSRSGFSQVCQRRQNRRLRATSARSCSAARSVFFKAIAKRVKRIVDALTGNLDPPGQQTLAQFGQCDIRLRCHDLMQPILMPSQFALLLTAHLTGPVAAGLSPTPDQRNRTRCAHPKMTTRRPRRAKCSSPVYDPLAKVKRMSVSHILYPIPFN